MGDSKFLFDNLQDSEIKESYKNLPSELTFHDVKNQITKIKYNCFVISLNERPIGLRYFWKIDKNLFDTGSWISKEFRGRGFGSLAFKEFIKKFQENSIFRMRPNNFAVENFARKNNFEEGENGFWYFSKINKI